MKQNTKDVLLVSLSDMHSGSERALFPPWIVKKEKTAANDHDPSGMAGSAQQIKIFNHFKHCASEVKERIGNKRLVIVHDGDATEGIHHNTIQIMSVNPNDHVNIHIELMDYFLKTSGFSKKRGDELHYVTGTESHTGNMERAIADYYDYIDAGFHDELRMKINNRMVCYTHHGGSAGDGQNEGDAYRNWLKRIYFNNLKDGKPQPDIIYTGHVHKPIYTSYVQDYHTIHGIILPSWQMKTRFAYRVAPFQKNSIGMTMTEITAESDIRIMKPLVMEM